MGLRVTRKGAIAPEYFRHVGEKSAMGLRVTRKGAIAPKYFRRVGEKSAMGLRVTRKGAIALPEEPSALLASSLKT